MHHDSLTILAIPGSLRPRSSNHVILHAISRLMPPNVEFIIYDGLGKLPHFDGNEDAPAEVEDLRRRINSANGILICSPEYAFGVPGSLKNALDWTVSSGEFTGKPTALVTAATGGDKAHAALLLTLSAIDARIAEGASLLIPYVRAKINASEVTDPGTLYSLRELVKAFVGSMER